MIMVMVSLSRLLVLVAVSASDGDEIVALQEDSVRMRSSRTQRSFTSGPRPRWKGKNETSFATITRSALLASARGGSLPSTASIRRVVEAASGRANAAGR